MDKKKEPAPPPATVKVVKRKKKLGVTCDKDCEHCRRPCDNPITGPHPHPLSRKERGVT